MTANSLIKDLERARKMYEDLARPFPTSWIDEMRLAGTVADELMRVRSSCETSVFQAERLLAGIPPSENLIRVAEGLRVGQELGRVLTQIGRPLSMDVLESTASLGRMAEQIAGIRVDALANVQSLSASIASMIGPVSRALEMSLAGQAAVAAIQPPHIGSLVGLGLRERVRLETSFGRQTKAFTALQAAVEPVAVSRLPELSVLTQLPAAQVFTYADVIRVTSEAAEEDTETLIALRAEIAGEITDVLPRLLQPINPQLVKMWLGARESLRSRNPDRARHVIVSLRTLFDHVFWALAPDADVSAWTKDPQHYHEGRLTRNARVLYICRSINYGPFTDYVKKSVAALLEFYKLFGGGTHAAEDRFTEEQLSVMLTHAEGYVRFLVEASRSRSA
jgi:hypothetical protein